MSGEKWHWKLSTNWYKMLEVTMENGIGNYPPMGIHYLRSH